MMRDGYPKRVLLAIDQLGNAILGGSEDETISSRVGRAARGGKTWGLFARAFIDRLFILCGDPPNHCERSIEWDEAK